MSASINIYQRATSNDRRWSISSSRSSPAPEVSATASRRRLKKVMVLRLISSAYRPERENFVIAA